jgi:hypothetical protein
MAEMGEFSDDVLLDELQQRAKRFGRVPTNVTVDALRAFALINFDEELAILLRDSADEKELAGVRSGSAAARFLEFSVGLGQLHVGLTPSQVTGTLVGRPERTLVLVSASHRVTVDLDEYGDFSLSAVGSGPIRFEVGAGPAKVVTDWLLPPRL